MTYLLARIVIAARNEDVESWTNILVVVVLAVLWALGGIIKARAKNAQGRDKGRAPGRPVARPPAQSKALRQQSLKEATHYGAAVRYHPAGPRTGQARTKLAEWRAAARKFAAEAEQAFRAETAEPAMRAARSVLKAERPPEISQLSEPAAMPLDAPVDETIAAAAKQTPQSDYLRRLLADYSDPDDLRRAILHYEILGKPLGLRDM
jgi:hypothetical protein